MPPPKLMVGVSVRRARGSLDGAGCPVAETANTTNLSGLTFQVTAFGV